MKQIIDELPKNSFIVTRGGVGAGVFIPYFDGCYDWIEEYLERYEIMENQDVLQAEMQTSLASGESDLVI